MRNFSRILQVNFDYSAVSYLCMFSIIRRLKKYLPHINYKKNEPAIRRMFIDALSKPILL